MSKLLNDPNEMSFLDHLEDLRWHILRSFIAILICGSIAFIFKDFIFDKIIFGPKNIDFFTYEILCKISNFIGFNDGFCITELPFRIQSRTMAGQFSAHIWTSIASGFIISFPFVLYQFWSFISPGFIRMKKNMREALFLFQVYFFLLVFYSDTTLSVHYQLIF